MIRHLPPSPQLVVHLLVVSLLALLSAPSNGAEQLPAPSARPSRSAIAIQRHDWLAPDLAALAALESRAQINRLSELRRQYPDDPRLWRLIGSLQAQLEQWPEAREAYAALARHHPSDPDNAYNLAVCLEHLGQSAAAIPYYLRALRLGEQTPFHFDPVIVRQRLSQLEGPP